MVNADGTLARGSGVSSVSRTANGSYLITFNTAVDTCAFIAIQGSATAQTARSSSRTGDAEPVPVADQPTQVRVFLYGALAPDVAQNADFQLAVFC